MKYTEQIHRIKEKLQQAQKADPDYKVFGADSHEYKLGKPISEEKLQQLEQKYGIRLPECFRSFLLHIGNGGKGRYGGAAPFYGLYAIDKCLKESKEQLAYPCVIYPKMSEEAWDKLIEKTYDEDITDDEYDLTINKAFGSLLTFGTQGCTYETAIVLEGEHRGRIVNTDMDLFKPYFAFEKNFLDWYERWLDEVISGEILYIANGFSYEMGGSAAELLAFFENSTEKEDKTDALEGLRCKKPPLDAEILAKVEAYAQKQDDFFTYWATILCISDFNRAKKYFGELAERDLLRFFQNIHWYSPDKQTDSNELLPIIREKLPHITDEETLRFGGYVLRETGVDYGEWLLPFAENQDYKTRSTAFYFLGQLKNKEKYLDTFIKGLHEEKPYVLTTVLQALHGVSDRVLLPHYQRLAQRFPTEDEDYVYININHRLKDFGLTVKKILKMRF
ncbi:SMI1/KNR4 family protein [Capnocytophaga sp.]|uniref:SMI1/KNR4 family protein n=1 Tax=Capnocytophaga sp. TaxID=44737 RepID=UPI0026DD2596|nr:SMI1/KNR4 family protein [Capnocytophaga sp.]MDO5104269.1 SMI1/KNR4 family protein [Capnocytophaga sp.]